MQNNVCYICQICNARIYYSMVIRKKLHSISVTHCLLFVLFFTSHWNIFVGKALHTNILAVLLTILLCFWSCLCYRLNIVIFLLRWRFLWNKFIYCVNIYVLFLSFDWIIDLVFLTNCKELQQHLHVVDTRGDVAS